MKRKDIQVGRKYINKGHRGSVYLGILKNNGKKSLVVIEGDWGTVGNEVVGKKYADRSSSSQYWEDFSLLDK